MPLQGGKKASCQTSIFIQGKDRRKRICELKGEENDHTETGKYISGTGFGFANLWLGSCLAAINQEHQASAGDYNNVCLQISI